MALSLTAFIDIEESSLMVTNLPSKPIAKPKSRRKFIWLVLVIGLLYSPKYLVRSVNHFRSDPYLGFQKLNGVQVPDGPYVEIEKKLLDSQFKPIDLGQAWPISVDANGNMILYINKEKPPSDFPDVPRTGQYLRSSDGKYINIGEDAAQLTVDGKLVQVTVEKMYDLTFKLNGQKIEPSPIRKSVTEGNMPILFAAANGVFLNVRYHGNEDEITGFTKSGKKMRLNQEVNLSESMAISALRKAGIFEAAKQSVGERSLMTTANGTIYSQSWASSHGLFQDWPANSGRLCVLLDQRFIIVPELKDTKINSEMMVTASGKVGLNSVGNCSYLTRPVIYDHGKVTLLPIPHGSISADLVGLADDGSAILQAKHNTAWLFFKGGKLYPMAELLEKGPSGKLKPFQSYRSEVIKLPEVLAGLRIQNPMLSDGSILCQTADERLVLLQRFQRVI